MTNVLLTPQYSILPAVIPAIGQMDLARGSSAVIASDAQVLDSDELDLTVWTDGVFDPPASKGSAPPVLGDPAANTVKYTVPVLANVFANCVCRNC